MASSTSEIDTNTTNNIGRETMDENKHIAASERGSSEVLAQAIEDLTVRDSKESVRSFSPNAMNNALPPVNTGFGINFNTRTTSPIADSSSPTFGLGAAHITTNSSPSTSQVSVGSVGPTLVASLLNQRHHYDLTPVMRNTSDVPPAGTKGNSHASGQAEGPHGIVSPETVEEEAQDFLHGEHLSLPADLSKAEDDGPILPSLRTTTIPTLPMQRAKSLSGAHQLSISGLPPRAQVPGPAPPQLADPPAPVEFPARKFYSFTSREQYKGMAPADVDEDLSDEESLQEHPDLTPYQPSRQEFAEIEESLPPEALESIFIARRRHSSIRESAAAAAVVVEGVAREDDVDEESSQKNHRLLQNPIPITDRQWSIPSLRMAQRLATDGSLASLTDHLDDESLLYVHPGPGGDMTDEDEASLSSRASSLYMCVGGGIQQATAGVPTSILEPRDDPIKITEKPPIWNDESSSFSQHRSTGSASTEGVPSFGSAPPEATTKVVVESPWGVLAGAQSSHSDENSAVAVDGDRAFRRKRKQRQREEAALSWIQSLQQQSQAPAVAEAASSKFLTGRTHNHAFHKTSDDAATFAAISEETPRLS